MTAPRETDGDGTPSGWPRVTEPMLKAAVATYSPSDGPWLAMKKALEVALAMHDAAAPTPAIPGREEVARAIRECARSYTPNPETYQFRELEIEASLKFADAVLSLALPRERGEGERRAVPCQDGEAV